MLEFHPTPVAVIGCYARPEVLDGLLLIGAQIRVASDELLLLAPAEERVGQLNHVGGLVEASDPGGLVIDLSGGFAMWTVRGEGRGEAFSRLCAIPPEDPPACLQGLFAQVPAKILVEDDHFHVLVFSVVGHHVGERLLGACADLSPRQLPAAAPSFVVRERAA